MNLSDEDNAILRTSVGDLPLDRYCFGLDGWELKILHVSAVNS